MPFNEVNERIEGIVTQTRGGNPKSEVVKLKNGATRYKPVVPKQEKKR